MARLPRAAHVLELVIGLSVFAAGQNLFAVLVAANPDIAAPSTPANLRVDARSATQIELAWDASTDDVGVTAYVLYRNGAQVYSGPALAYTDSGLTPNTGYSYTVAARDEAGNTSGQSAPLATATLADTIAPGVPANVRQTASTVSSISIAWNAATDNVGVTGYDIFRDGQLVRSQSGTSYTDTGLNVYTGYTYTIRARDGANNTSQLSQPLFTSTAQDVTAPSVPDNLRQTGQTITSVSLAWDMSSDDVGIAGYRLYRNGTLIASPNGMTYTDTGLMVDTEYIYTVAAIDAAGNLSPQSSPLTANSAPDTTAPSVPLNVRTTDIRDTSIVLAWNTSSDDVGVVGYKLYRDGVLVASPTTTAYTDTGLTPITAYNYTIRAVDAAGNDSAPSNAYEVTTAYDTTAPSVPANLQSLTQTDTTITLSWDTSTDNVAVASYDVYRNGQLITTTAATGYTDTGLNVETGYSYTIRATDTSDNNSDQSLILSISTLPDEIPPATPANLVASDATVNAIVLTWDAATDDVAVTDYRLYRNGVIIATQAELSFTDTGLRYGRSYNYQVTARDQAGNESPLSEVTAQSTLPDTAAPVVTLQAPKAGQSLQFTVPVSATASDNLELARVEFFVGSRKIATRTASPYAINWNTYQVANGSHVITARAFDATGNTASQAVTVSINNPPPPVVGDLNNDYKVTIFDLSILLARWGQSGPADFNKSGKVDIFDLSVLLARYGKQ